MHGFLLNCWYVAAWDYELADAPISRKIAGLSVLFYRKADGAVVALEDRCCHRHAPLSLGRIEGDSVRCMYHGMRFAPDGRCVEIPGQRDIPVQACVRAFPVVERHSWIWVWMGGAAEADPDLIPPAIGLDDPRWMLRASQLDVDAGYELINDNLTDFSHLSYVHPDSFRADEQHAQTRPLITVLPRGIRVQRWVQARPLQQAPAADAAKAAAPAARNHWRTDNWSSYDYLAPGVLLLTVKRYPPGTAQACGEREPEADRPHLSALSSCQAVTPVSTNSSRYFYSFGADAASATVEKAEVMLAVATKAFNEDKAMIEAQQRRIDERPKLPPLVTTADEGLLAMRRVMAALIAQERARRDGAKALKLTELQPRAIETENGGLSTAEH